MTETLKTWLPILVAYGVRVLGALVALWVSFKISGWVQHKLADSLRAKKLDETLAIFFGNMVKWLVLTAAILACLSVFGIETTSFAALLGAAGLAVGLAFQGTLSNFAAGVMLLVFRPFKVGDDVVVAGKAGKVKEIGLFSCSLDTGDNRRIIVPNSAVANGVIENVTFNDRRRVEINVEIPWDVAIDKAEAALNAVASTVPGRDEKLGHQVVLVGLGNGKVQWQVRVWCATPTHDAVWYATVLAVKRTLEQLEIPTPKMAVQIAGSLLGAPAAEARRS